MKSTRLGLALVLGFAIQGDIVRPPSLEGQVYDFSRIEIDVQKSGVGELKFKFFILRKLPHAEEKIPAKLYWLTVFEPNDKRALWQIETTKIESMTTNVSYGIVPVGFKQILPSEGSAPKLELGHRYSIWVYCEANGIGTSSFMVE
jgi:hypothetical protein